MPSLYAFFERLRRDCDEAGHKIPGKVWKQAQDNMRRDYPGQRIYIPPLHSRKDPERAAALRRAVKRLPTGVAAAEHGVTPRHARRVAKKGTNPDA